MEGVGVMQLEVRSMNLRAKGFYEAHGFSVIECFENFYADGGDAYRMSAFVSSCRTG